MHIIEAPDSRIESVFWNSLFLAGGITNCSDWQAEILAMLSGPALTVYNPRRKNFPIHDPNAAREQITWEYHRLKWCQGILFWFAKGSLNPIVLYELGMWGNSRLDKTIFVGCDPEYQRIQDVQIQTGLARPDIKIVYSLKDLAEQVNSTPKLT
jgi:Nucleoside 2-deoxyribosyltransferase like